MIRIVNLLVLASLAYAITLTEKGSGASDQTSDKDEYCVPSTLVKNAIHRFRATGEWLIL